MKCIVTAGPTYEPLDEVRRLTNFSTGKLGTDLASHLADHGHKVTLLRGYYATYEKPTMVREVIPFTTTLDLHDHLKQLSQNRPDAVFHAAAVNDFTFGQVWQRGDSLNSASESAPSKQLIPVAAGKIPTRQPGLLVELKPVVKILPCLRAWLPQAILVGWKYELDGNRADALDKGWRQIEECQTNYCVVNGRAYGEGFGLLSAERAVRHLENADLLKVALAGLLP